MRRLTDDQRRARIGVRHALAPDHRLLEPTAAVDALVALHATEPTSVHLGLRARTTDPSVPAIDQVLYRQRSLVKVMGMRRTLFVVTPEVVPEVVGSVGRRVAGAEQRRLAKELIRDGITNDPESWFEHATVAILDALGDGELTTAQLRAAVPEVAGTIDSAPGTKWGQTAPIAPRVLTMLAAAGIVVRATNAGHWRISRPTFAAMTAWLGTQLDIPAEREAYAALVGRWLAAFGPGTEADIVWWLGSTKAVVRQALADVNAEPVRLEGGGAAYVHPDDTDVPDPGPWVALLPVLDSTTMGWRDRGFYLDPGHKPQLFDSVGNADATVWVNGRIVGRWFQTEEQGIGLQLLEPLPRRTHAALGQEAGRLADFIGAERITTVFPRRAKPTE